MSEITLSNGIRSNLLSLQDAAGLLDRTQNRISTGKKVNTALDNPLNFFQSSALNARAGDLQRILEGIGQGVQTLRVADAGITAMQKLVENAQGGALAALQSASTTARVNSGIDPVTRQPIALQLTQSLIAAPVNMTAGDAFGIHFTAPGVTPVPASPVALTVGTAYPVVDDAGAPLATSPITLTTVGNLIDIINNSPAFRDAATGERFLNAKLDAGGRLTIDNKTTGTLRMTFTEGAGTANTLFSLLGDYDPRLPASTTTDTGVVTSTLNETRKAFANQYKELLKQITNLSRDATYNGTNLLNGQTLEMLFNEDTDTLLVIRGVVFDAKGLGLQDADARRDYQSDFEIKAAMDRLKTAMDRLRGQAATFGSNLSVAETRQRFTKEAVKTFTVGADQLVLADINEEGANILALQTRQQLSTQSLSLAAQAEQAVLRLFS